ncbi:MAG TPA: hypothetical protein VJT11_05735 [Nitrospiraceae bacterium]|nr:hypothetical protein [Nitrospiraceae bacterium]
MNVETADDFATLLFEEAKAFLETFQSHKEKDTAVAYLHAALLLGYCALEAQINNISAEFADRHEFNLQEKSIIREREIALKNGQFELTKTLKIFRLEDRFEFLYRRFKKQPLNKTDKWWGQLKEGLETRNAITHPRTLRTVTEKEVTTSLKAILEAIDVLFRAVYKRPYPGKGRQLDSLVEL